jgi:hypothetical protein
MMEDPFLKMEGQVAILKGQIFTLEYAVQTH